MKRIVLAVTLVGIVSMTSMFVLSNELPGGAGPRRYEVVSKSIEWENRPAISLDRQEDKHGRFGVKIVRYYLHGEYQEARDVSDECWASAAVGSLLPGECR